VTISLLLMVSFIISAFFVEPFTYTLSPLVSSILRYSFWYAVVVAFIILVLLESKGYPNDLK
jgi:hypothetical protein